jgi:hypothetical protein
MSIYTKAVADKPAATPDDVIDDVVCLGSRWNPEGASVIEADHQQVRIMKYKIALQSAVDATAAHDGVDAALAVHDALQSPDAVDAALAVHDAEAVVDLTGPEVVAIALKGRRDQLEGLLLESRAESDPACTHPNPLSVDRATIYNRLQCQQKRKAEMNSRIKELRTIIVKLERSTKKAKILEAATEVNPVDEVVSSDSDSDAQSSPGDDELLRGRRDKLKVLLLEARVESEGASVMGSRAKMYHLLQCQRKRNAEIRSMVKEIRSINNKLDNWHSFRYEAATAARAPVGR